MQKLTPRQLEVAKLIDQQLTNEEIAAKLGVSTSTVRQHIRDLRLKLGVGKKRHIPQVVKGLGLID